MSWFFSIDFFSSFTSQAESGIWICKPPTIFAPYCFNNRAEQPAPSPLNNPIVATQSTCLPFQRSECRLIKSLTIIGAFENWTGHAKTTKSCFDNSFAASSFSIGITCAVSSNKCINFPIQCFVFPVPLNYTPNIMKSPVWLFDDLFVLPYKLEF